LFLDFLSFRQSLHGLSCLLRVFCPYDVFRLILDHNPASVKRADPRRRVDRYISIQENRVESSFWLCLRACNRDVDL
jgi:hypothetical protein